MATKDERIIEIVVNGQKANANLKEMEGAARALSSQLKTLAPGTAEFVAKSAELRQVQSRMDGVKQSIAGVTRETSLMRDGVMKSLSGMVGSVGVLDLYFRGLAFIQDSIAELKETKQADAGLDASLKSTGQAAGVARKDVDELAKSLQKTTLFRDDMTKNAASLLLTFTNIKKGVFEEALPAIEDMATKMANGGEIDLKSASIQVGKALNDPIKGITALTRVGVSFTEGQKEMIKHMVETGDRAGAQKMILAELNKEFGGSAEAARKAAGGGANFNMQMHDIRIEIGRLAGEGKGLIMPYFVLLLTHLVKLAGILRDTPAFIKENKETFLALGVAIVSLNAANISAAASTLAQAAAERARAIASRASTTAQWLLNAAMTANPIGVVIAGLALLAGAFIYVYKHSETFRATIAGISAAAGAFFESMKKAAMQSLGGLADLIAGVFTFDLAKIRSGAAALKASFSAVGKDTAAAYAAGYDGKLSEEAKARRAAAEAERKRKLAEAGQQGTAEAEEETIAQRKAREKAAKEAEKARKKAAADALRDAKHHAAEVEKARKEFHTATLKADQEFERLKVEAMAEGLEKTLAKLKLQRDEELRGLEEKKKAVLANIAATEQDKQHLLDQYRQTAEMAEARYQQDVKEAREKQAEKDRKDEFARLDGDEEEKLVVLDNGWLEQKSRLKKQTVEFMAAEQARADAELKLRKKTAQQKLALLVAAGKSETAEATKLRNTILRIDGQIADGQESSDKDITKFKRDQADERKQLELELAGAKVQLGEQVLDAVMEQLDQESTAYQVAQAIRKTMALAEIAINLEKQLSLNAVAAREKDALLPGSGIVYEVVMNGIAIAGAAASAAKVAGFAAGGYTGDGDGPADGSGHRVAGVVHAGEWVAPKWMLAQPKYANVVGYLEAERRGYARGGYTSTPSLPSAATGGSQAPDATAALLQQLIGVVASQNERMNGWQARLGVDYHAGSAEQAMGLRNQLKAGAGLTKTGVQGV